MPATPTAAILDLDGTLVDSNYLHALAWSRTFHAAGIDVPLWELHRHVGMGGDQFVPAIAGERVEREQGDALREAWREQFLPLLDEVRPLPGAHDLLQTLHERGLTVALASSAPQEDLDHYLDLLDAHDLVETATTSADVEQTKPAPDLVGVVLDRLDGAAAVLVGDSVWDVRAAGRAGVPTIGVLTGGFGEAELLEAGAVAVYPDAAALCAKLDEALAGASTPAGAGAARRRGAA